MLQVILTSPFLIMKYVKKYKNFEINYENGMILIKNKSTRISNKTATTIEQILTNSYLKQFSRQQSLNVMFQIIYLSLKFSLMNKDI